MTSATDKQITLKVTEGSVWWDSEPADTILDAIKAQLTDLPEWLAPQIREDERFDQIVESEITLRFERVAGVNEDGDDIREVVGSVSALVDIDARVLRDAEGSVSDEAGTWRNVRFESLIEAREAVTLEVAHADLEPWRSKPAGTVREAVEAEIAAVAEWFPEHCDDQGEQRCDLTIRRVWDNHDIEDHGALAVTIDDGKVVKVDGWYLDNGGRRVELARP